MILLAGVFLWQDLQVPREVLLVAASTAAALLALLTRSRRPVLGPAALVACSLAGGVWYAVGRSPLLLIGMGVAWFAATVGVVRGGREPSSLSDRVHNVLLWHGFVLASVIASSGLYFQFLTLGMPDQVGRRLVLTGLWLLAGLVLVGVARRTGQKVARDAAFGFVAMALGKALVYDSLHLAGFLRIGEFVAAGLLLWAGAWAARRRAVGAS